jgi:hypothetical protein
MLRLAVPAGADISPLDLTILSPMETNLNGLETFVRAHVCIFIESENTHKGWQADHDV